MNDGRAADNLAVKFGERVRMWRLTGGMTLDQLASRAGMSKTGLWQVETGKSMPGIDTALKLSEALGVPIGALLGQAAPPPSALREVIVDKISELHLLARRLP